MQLDIEDRSFPDNGKIIWKMPEFVNKFQEKNCTKFDCLFCGNNGHNLLLNSNKNKTGFLTGF